MKKLFLTLTIGLFIFGVANAQADYNDGLTDFHTVTVSIPEVAVVDIEGVGGVTAITLGATFSGEAGEGLTFGATNSNLWLNYTSVTSTEDANRSIGVMITNGTVPTGLSLKVSAGGTSGTGTVGSKAVVANALSATSQNIITGIGSCYTGDGVSNGSQLTYTLEMDGSASFADLTNVSEALEITYTITDN